MRHSRLPAVEQAASPTTYRTDKQLICTQK